MDEDVARTFRVFADSEARGVSEMYFEWANGVAVDDDIVFRIAQLASEKQQPNLVFAAARRLGAPEGSYPLFRAWLLAHWAEVVPVVMSHSTQTNEAARCAVLLPVLSRLEGELALIEAGASAGLVLYPDRYSYRYDVESSVVELDPAAGPSPVVIPCVIDPGSVPTRLPKVGWRAGVDLDPIDTRDTDQMGWLEALVWPEHDARRARLHAAAALVATDPPHLLRGDLVSVIPRLIAEAPPNMHVVVFHSAVLSYLPAGRRRAFVDLMTSYADVTWISNEGRNVLPAITEQVQAEFSGKTVLAVNGRATALVGPHGQSYQAL